MGSGLDVVGGGRRGIFGAQGHLWPTWPIPELPSLPNGSTTQQTGGLVLTWPLLPQIQHCFCTC